MQYLVRVPTPGDLPAFSEAIRHHRHTEHAGRDDAWVAEVTAQDDRPPADAAYLVVEAPSKDDIENAIEEGDRHPPTPKLWVNGPPVYDVIGQRETRERPSYPARDFG